MNCHECQELIQRWLDGETSAAEQPTLDSHLALCASCRDLHASGNRLLEGLRIQGSPVPSADLSMRIRRAVVAQARRQLVFRRAAVISAAAASIVAVLSANYFWPRRGDKPLVAVVQPNTSDRSLTLNRSVTEAGEAVLAITRKAADETVGQGRMLLPNVLPDTPRADMPELAALLGPPSRSLREIQDNMTAGLEPVTSSARRALDLFLRELPGGERNKRGS
jgi:hypothetical protein